jgi:hypothetical protein
VDRQLLDSRKIILLPVVWLGALRTYSFAHFIQQRVFGSFTAN